MIKHNVTITNAYGQEETKVLYFNITRMEIFELQKKYKEGYENHVKSVIDTKDTNSMLDIFSELVLSAYCEVNDGKIIKNDEIKNNFYHSEEYSELMFYLLDAKDTTKAENFFKSIMPKQVVEQLNYNNKQNNINKN